jgi:hypothetical protein
MVSGSVRATDDAHVIVRSLHNYAIAALKQHGMKYLSIYMFLHSASLGRPKSKPYASAVVVRISFTGPH